MIVTRQQEYTERGAYSIVGVTGTMAAGAAAASPIFSFLWNTTTENARALVDRIAISFMSLGVGFTAGSALFEAVMARSFTAADTGGGVLTITTNNAKRSTKYGTTLLGEARISTTAALSAGTRTLDAQAFGAVQCGVSTATNTVHLATSAIWDTLEMKHPQMLSKDEGFIIRATVPATGTWQAIMTIDWREVLG